MYKKNMREFFLFLLVLGVAFQPLLCIADTITITPPLESTTLEEFFEDLLGFLQKFAIGIAPLFIVYGAFLFLTSGGNPEQVQRAKNIIFWTFVGMAVILLVNVIVETLKKFFEMP